MALAGVNACEDNRVGIQRKKGDFIVRLCYLFYKVGKQKGVSLRKRDNNALWRKFKEIGTAVTLFQAKMTQAENGLPSGYTDVVAYARKLYKKASGGKQFPFIREYEILKTHSKWRFMITSGAKNSQLAECDLANLPKRLGRDRQKAEDRAAFSSTSTSTKFDANPDEKKVKSEQFSLKRHMENNQVINSLTATIASLRETLKLQPENQKLQDKVMEYTMKLMDLQNKDLADHEVDDEVSTVYSAKGTQTGPASPKFPDVKLSGLSQSYSVGRPS